MWKGPIATAIRDELLPLADATTPNAFECAWLAGEATDADQDFAALARRLAPPVALVTSVAGADARPDREPARDGDGGNPLRTPASCDAG